MRHYYDYYTGKEISKEEYDRQQEELEENRNFDDWEDFQEFDTFDEDEYLA